MLDPIHFVDIEERIEHPHEPYRLNYVHWWIIELNQYSYSTFDLQDCIVPTNQTISSIPCKAHSTWLSIAMERYEHANA